MGTTRRASARRHRRSGGAAGRRRVVAGLSCLVALLAISAAVVIGQLARSVPAQGTTSSTPPYFTAAVTPTQNLVDGEKMTITVTRTAAGTAAGLEIEQVAIAWCALGTHLPHTSTNSLSAEGQNSVSSTALPGTADCSSSQFPLNGDPLLFTTISPPKNPTGTYPSITTTVQAQSTRSITLDHGLQLSCDATSPCTLAVAVQTAVKTTKVLTRSRTTIHGTYFFMTPVTYQPTTIAGSCGGSATGELTSIGPDRLGGLLTTLTDGACAAGVGGGKALSTPLTSAQSDGSALCGFAGGKDDIAYSAVGYGTSSSPFNPANCTLLTGGPQPDRPYVAVPIALNAVVLAHTQTLKMTTVEGRPAFQDYPSQLDITDAQLAQLLGRDGHTTDWAGPLGQALITENPTLLNDFYVTGTLLPTTSNNGSTFPVIHRSPGAGSVEGAMVTSGTQATTYLATSLLHNLVPTTLTSVTAGHSVLKPTADFATASPRYDTIPITGLIDIVHNSLPTATYGGDPWALLSASDAGSIWFGMDSFALQVPGTAPPVYAAPTKADMQAAADDMLAEPDGGGTLIPNPQPTVAKGQKPYPLTYVEYAIVPTQPLVTSSCTPRTQSEQNLVDWLDYVIGPGQTLLPTGMAPLTPALEAQAKTAIAQVGKAASPCGVKVTVTVTVTTSGTTTTTATTPPSGGSSSTTPAASTTASASNPPTGASTGAGETASGPGSSGGVFSSPAREPGSGATASSGSTAAKSSGSPTPKTTTSKPAVPQTATNLVGFRVAEGPGWLWPAVGLLILFVLLPGLALLASGRSPRQALAGLDRHLRGPSTQPVDDQPLKSEGPS